MLATMIRAIAVLFGVVGLTVSGIVPALAGKPVRFVAIQADPPGADDGSNRSLNEEFVVLKNVSDHSASLKYYSVRLGEKDYSFPSDFRLQPGSKVRVHTGKGQDARHDLYWGRTKYAYPNQPSYFLTLWGLQGFSGGTPVVEIKDTCAVLGPTTVNGSC